MQENEYVIHFASLQDGVVRGRAGCLGNYFIITLFYFFFFLFREISTPRNPRDIIAKFLLLINYEKRD